MHKKLALIIAYFGELPEYSKVFFHSLNYNPEIDLFLVTDQDVNINMDNLIVIKKTFSELKNDIQNLFEFKIVLDTPYKLCDYKPIYGMLFKDILSEYPFWGYCDLDMVLGDVFSFLPENILNNYSKIYEYGHLTIYKNDPENNQRFMSEVGMNYQDVFTTKVIKVFDETEGIQRKYDLMGIPAYTSRDCADITPWSYQLKRVETGISKERLNSFNYKKQLFFWENGKVFRGFINPHTNKIEYDSFNYLHFQKREMKIRFPFNSSIKSFFITNQGIMEKKQGFNIKKEDFKRYNNYNLIREISKGLQRYYFIWRRRLLKYIFRR